MIKILLRRILLWNKFRSKNIKCASNLVALKCKIGDFSIINSGTEIDGLCNIGRHGYFGRGCSVTKTNIGNYCSIANYVSLGQGEHDLTKVSTSSIFYENGYEQLTEKDCTIGNDVWIGVGAVIRRGVTVGNGAVIGAHAVVTKDVPPFAVVVGAPAKILKYRFTEKKIQKIEASKWWNLDKITAKKIIEKIEAENNL